MAIKKLFFDVETTGLDPEQCAIHQLAFLIEIDGEVVYSGDWRIKPFPTARIEPTALEVSGVSIRKLKNYPDHDAVFKDVIDLLAQHVDRFDRSDKIHLVGYNNRFFDDRFLRAFFKQNNDNFFGSWFWPDTIDVLVLASQHLLHKRSQMLNFKLGTVAETLGVRVEDEHLHDGLYDVQVTREVYNRITGSDLM